MNLSDNCSRRDVYIEKYSLITGLGRGVDSNFSAICSGTSSIRPSEFNGENISLSLIDDTLLPFVVPGATRLENIFIQTITDALSSSSVDPADPRTAFVIASTKGNISNVSGKNSYDITKGRVKLHEMALFVSSYFSNPNTPVVVCNACISGLSAIIEARFLLASGNYDAVILAGGDLISDFTISGFAGFKALSDEQCRPFDAARKGLSLGEGCGAIILTGKKYSDGTIAVSGAASSNDANHISGPSRDGSGLYLAIDAAMREAAVSPEEIDSLCAHGTGTEYNDEMESKAFALASLLPVPTFSLKGFWGHSLGGAGVIESVLCVHAMKEDVILPSGAFSNLGVSQEIAVSRRLTRKKNTLCLKTGSGFGGCNAGVIFRKKDLL